MGRWDRWLAVGTVIALPLWGQGVDSTHPSTSRAVTSPVVTTALGKRDMWHVGNTVTVIDVDSVLRISPARTLTDVLEGRVPGLMVMRTSGVPGAPSTIYLRGEGDIAASNQPIIVLDGIRLSANRSAPPPVNLASLTTGGLVSAPSALDQIDPHAIATIEVLHGPAATALYGSDAGAGVIVLTTERGSGRMADGKNAIHLTATYGGGISSLPGNYPANVFRFGTTGGGFSANGLCPATAPDCRVDSLIHFQALNDTRYSPFGNAGNSYGSISVAGGL